MKKIFITRKLPGLPEEILRKSGFNVEVFPGKKSIPRSTLFKKCKDIDALVSLLTDKIDKELIDQMKNCRIIANCAVGYNNIDVEYAKSKNIIVTNTPNILTDATADLTLALVLACARRLHEGNNMIRSKKFYGWQPDMLLGVELTGKTVGIIGAGRIGQAAAKRLKSFGTKIIYYDRNKRTLFEKQLKAKKVSLKYLLKNSDIISIHLPLNTDTFHFIDKEKLSLLKSTSIIVNTSRGEIIDEKSLIELLIKKKIYAAGFDVYENEPVINPKLLKLENVFLLPHIGSATIETRSAMAQLCAKNIIRVLQSKSPVTPI